MVEVLYALPCDAKICFACTVRHVEVEEPDPLHFAKSNDCTLWLGKHEMHGEKLVFDRGIDLE